MKSIKEIIKYSKAITENSIKCKCSHTVAIPPHLDRTICSWCGNYVFRNPKDEFSYRMKERLKK